MILSTTSFTYFKKKWSVILFFSVVFTNGIAQTNTVQVIGLITNNKGEPVPFATIALASSTIGTTSDHSGNFKLNLQKQSEYNILVKLIGYEDQDIILKDTKQAKMNLDIVLTEVHLNVNEVKVTGKSMNTIVEQKGFSASSIDLSEQQNQIIGINQILGQVSGVSVRQQGGLGSRSNYSINGLGGNAIRFFIDEIPMDYFGSSFSVNTIPISLINTIDIYKGVVPIELGGDALGGAVNLVTKKKQNNSVNLSYTYGSFNTHQASVSLFFRNQKSGATVKMLSFYNYSDNNYEVWGDDIYYTDPNTFEAIRGVKAERFHDAFESKAIKTEIGFTNKKWADYAYLGLLLSGLNKEVQHGATMFVPFGEANYSQNVLMPYLEFKNTRFIDSKLSISLFSSFSELNRNRIDTSRNIYNWLGETESIKRTIGGEQTRTLNKLNDEAFLNRFNISYKLSDYNEIKYNHIYTHLKRTERDSLVTQKTIGYFAPQYFHKNIFGLGLETKWFSNRLKTNVFAKSFSYKAKIKTRDTGAGVTSYETVHAEEQNFGYGLASSYTLIPQVVLSLSAEQASRLPQANEILGDGLNILSNPDLKSEESININLGIDIKIWNTKNNSISVYTNLFYRDVSQQITLVSSSDPSLLQNKNFDAVEIKGIDTRFVYNYKELIQFSNSTSYLNPIIKTDKDHLGNDNGLANTRIPNMPFFQSNAELKIKLNSVISKYDAFVFMWNTLYVDEFYRHSEKYGSENKDLIPKQFVNTGTISYKLAQIPLNISLSANNIFNAQAFDNYAVQKPGRAFFLKLSFQII